MPGHTTTVFRIVHQRYADAPFSGEGGLHYHSRWASKGQRVSYAADHLALAALEKIAGVQRADLLTEMVYVRAEIDASHVKVLSKDDWPEDWDALPANHATRRVGDHWLHEQQSIMLRVPSVLLPHSYNVVINAAHPEMESLHVVETNSLLLDNRVLQRLGALTF